MCILVVVGKYHCGHERSPSHAIPYEFIRQCDDSLRHRGCSLVPNEEDIPWLCPNCHWDYVKENLTPLWQQTTITKCRMSRDVQMYPAEPSYVNAQKEADRLGTTFQRQQDAITSSATSYHELRDSTLRGFLAENFRVCLRHAHNAHRPWSLSYMREPFVRARADTDVDPSSPGLADGHTDLRSPDPSNVEIDQGVVHPDLSNVETDQGAAHPDVQPETIPPAPPVTPNSNRDRSPLEDEDLGCLWCDNYGGSAGVTVGRRLCTECEHQPRRMNGFDLDTFNTLMQSLNERIQELRGPTGEHRQNASLVAVSQPDLSSLQMGAPTTIPPEHRGALDSFLARHRDGETLADAMRDTRLGSTLPPAGRSAIGSRIDPIRDPRLTSGPSDAERATMLEGTSQHIRSMITEFHNATRRMGATDELSNIAIPGDEMGDGAELGRFFDNSGTDTMLPMQHISEVDPDEPPRQRRRLNPPEEEEEGGEEGDMEGAGESDS